MRFSPTRLVAGTFVVGALSVALGSSAWGATLTPKQAVANAIAATESATSVKFTGAVVQGAQQISLNVFASNAGVGEGTIGIGKGVATVKSVGGTIYFMGSPAFWTQEGGKSAAQLFANKWVSTSATSKSGQSLAQFLNSANFMKQLFGSNLKNSVFTPAGTGSVNGQPATVIAGHDKNKNTGGRIFIASTGTPYILRITINGKSGTGALTFSSFNQPVNPVAPASSINLDTLGSSTSG